MKNQHQKKKTPVIIITFILLLYYLLFFFVVTYAVKSLIGKLILGIVPLALGIALIYVANERINEINGGQEDDLSKY